jgi:hypothetical protein
MNVINLIKNLLATFELDGQVNLFSTMLDSNVNEAIEDLESELCHNILSYEGVLKLNLEYLMVYDKPLVDYKTDKPIPADFTVTYQWGVEKNLAKIYLYEITI